MEPRLYISNEVSHEEYEFSKDDQRLYRLPDLLWVPAITFVA